MRNLDTGFYQALVNAKDRGIVARKLVTFTGWTWATPTGATDRVARSFWSEDDDVTMSIVSQIDNQASNRTFYGDVNLDVGRIVRSSQMVIQTVTVSLSANAPIVEDFIRGYDIRLATVEIWDALLDPTSRALAGTAPAFLGVIDGAPINTEAAGGEEIVEINVVNDLMVMLTRTNPAKSSGEEQKKRGNGYGDEFGKYAGSVKDWKIPWGEK